MILLHLSFGGLWGCMVVREDILASIPVPNAPKGSGRINCHIRLQRCYGLCLVAIFMVYASIYAKKSKKDLARGNWFPGKTLFCLF
ncbi:MAG: hypothetical protein LBH06_09405 [Rikenellaceae bacterium]|jgi:hypothetical protein|nr:hypothetical protein [Rikenellaceae bacterium]